MTDHEIINLLRKDLKAKNKQIQSLQQENRELLVQNNQMKGQLKFKKEMKNLISELRDVLSAKDFIKNQQDIIFKLNQKSSD